jgi:hypothetical protein
MAHMKEREWTAILRNRVRRSGLTVMLAVALALTLWAIRGQVELAIGAAACLERAKYELILCVAPPLDGELFLGAAVAVWLAILLGMQLRRDRA